MGISWLPAAASNRAQDAMGAGAVMSCAKPEVMSSCWGSTLEFAPKLKWYQQTPTPPVLPLLVCEAAAGNGSQYQPQDWSPTGISYLLWVKSKKTLFTGVQQWCWPPDPVPALLWEDFPRSLACAELHLLLPGGGYWSQSSAFPVVVAVWSFSRWPGANQTYGCPHHKPGSRGGMPHSCCSCHSILADTGHSGFQ